jgi:DNA-binding MarR family transcriptional regulator
MVPKRPSGSSVSRERVVRVAQFRLALRDFLGQSDLHVRESGLTPQRYLLLLTVMGAPDRTGEATISEVAERMGLSRNAASELATRAERDGLLMRMLGEPDARFVRLRATPAGEQRVGRVISAGDHARAELAEALGVLPEVFEASLDS